MDGNDQLFVLISEASDKLVDLIRLADARGNQPELRAAANQCYTDVLELTGKVVML